jgi:hypothetical protein
LQIGLRAGVFERRQRVSVDFLIDAGSFSQTPHPTNGVIDSVIHQKDRFVQMRLFHAISPILATTKPQVRT